VRRLVALFGADIGDDFLEFSSIQPHAATARTDVDHHVLTNLDFHRDIAKWANFQRQATSRG